MSLPTITIGMVSFNRPQFLKESIESLYHKPGRDDFEFILWDNDSNEETKKLCKELQDKYKFNLVLHNKNVGQDCLKYMVEKMAKGKYFIMTEEDMIWFQDNWLDNLIKGFEIPPDITDKGKELGYKNEWGILATNVLIDPVNNAGMWGTRLKGMIEKTVQDTVFWCNVRAGGGALIFRTEDLKEYKAFPASSNTVNGHMETVNRIYESLKYPTGHIRDTYIYHACSPYWNQLFPKVWEIKQKGQTIEEAFKQYQGLAKFDFSDSWLLQVFLQGKFKDYAQELCDIVNRK